MMYFVGAFTQNYAMGNAGHLPWRGTSMQRDTERLKGLVSGKTIVMGERTYHDYKDIAKTFQTTDIYVISKTVTHLPNAQMVRGIEQIIQLGKRQDIWVIGGGKIFTALLPYVDCMYLTRIEVELPGDTFFPKYNPQDWNISEELFLADEHNGYPYSFLELRRKLQSSAEQ